MHTATRSGALLAAGIALGASVLARHAWAEPQGSRGGCPCHKGDALEQMGGNHRADMAVIHSLFADSAIRRSIREIPGGVETITESSTPEGAARIQAHVAAMQARLQKGEPIHARDPLFAELFMHAGRIEMVVEHTPKGVKVKETSSDPYTVKLIRAHAAVVTKFIENGRREMHQNHAVPAR